MSTRSAVGTIWTGLLALAALAMAALAIATVFGGLRYARVLSPSMVPAIAPGDLVVTRQVPTSQLRIGDIPLLVDGLRGPTPVAHRIVAISPSATGPEVTTKGDANDETDLRPLTVTSSEVPVVWVVVPLSWLPLLDGRLALGAIAALVMFGVLVVLLSLLRAARRT